MSKKLIEALHTIIAAKKVYFHGTSTKFLRSILKQGVLPTTEEGVWRDTYKQEDTSVISPSKKSLEGSYWTTSVINASRYANDASRKLGGNTLFIAATLETKTTLPDEDDFLSIIERGVGSLWGKGYNTSSSERAWGEVYYGILLNKKFGKEALKNWRNTFVEWLNDLYPDKKYMTPEYIKILDKLLLIELRRRMSYMDKGEYKRLISRTINSYLYPKEIEWDQIDEKFPKPNSSEEEDNRRKQTDLLSKKIKKIVDRPHHASTLRITTPVKFSGANKITMVLEAISDEDYNYKFKVHYGSIPSEFIAGWKEAIGSKFEIVK